MARGNIRSSHLPARSLIDELWNAIKILVFKNDKLLVHSCCLLLNDFKRATLLHASCLLFRITLSYRMLILSLLCNPTFAIVHMKLVLRESSLLDSTEMRSRNLNLFAERFLIFSKLRAFTVVRLQLFIIINHLHSTSAMFFKFNEL